MVSDSTLQLMFKKSLPVEFWCNIKEQQLSEQDMEHLPFPIKYLCEVNFFLTTSTKITG